MLIFLRSCQQHIIVVKIIIFILLLLPFLILVYQYFFGVLGINPLDVLMDTTGRWAFHSLLLSLLITPLRRWLTLFFRMMGALYGRRLSDWNWLIRCRRMVGLFSFFYALLHFFLYAYFEFDFNWGEIGYDIKTRPFIILGFLGFSGLLILSLTSPRFILRKMGRYWRMLHRLVYVVVILIAMHFYFLSKYGDIRSLIYAAFVFILLMDRVLFATLWMSKLSNDNGMESKR